MVLAAQLAKSDPSAKVVVEVLQALQFRRADRLVGEILQSAPEEIWQRVVREGYPDQLADPAQTARLMEVRRAELAAQTDPLQVLGNLTEHRLERRRCRGPDRFAHFLRGFSFAG
jgi:alkylated DNA nucleotide flippase Atl1